MRGSVSPARQPKVGERRGRGVGGAAHRDAQAGGVGASSCNHCAFALSASFSGAPIHGNSLVTPAAKRRSVAGTSASPVRRNRAAVFIYRIDMCVCVGSRARMRARAAALRRISRICQSSAPITQSGRSVANVMCARGQINQSHCALAPASAQPSCIHPSTLARTHICARL